MKGDFIFDLDSENDDEMEANDSCEWGAGASFAWNEEVRRINQVTFRHKKFKKNQL